MENKSFLLEIITATQTQSISVEWVEVEGPTGCFLVGPDHSPIVSTIKNKGTLTYKKTGGAEESLVTAPGIFYMHNNRAIALLEQ